ncbi:MAG: hypothetical protein K6G15_01005 [Desulfovibrio sp.]|nr:hypothetical protein [Desulfovibrio sp.]
MIFDENNKEIFLSGSSYRSVYRNREKINDNLRKTLRQEKFNENIDYIMKSLGIEPLPTVCNRAIFMKCLNARTAPNEPIIDPIVFDSTFDAATPSQSLDFSGFPEKRASHADFRGVSQLRC